MKSFCFTVDDNIRFLKEINERGYDSIFLHPYLAMLKRLHERFDLKIQLNLFFRMNDFDLSQMSECYRSEWASVSDWLKLSFHSELENVRPYENSGFDEVFSDCRDVNDEILRFASEKSLAKTTTVHYCQTTEDGVRALAENGVIGLLGLFGSEASPSSSYSIEEELAAKIRSGEVLSIDGVSFAAIDMVINTFRCEDILPKLGELSFRDSLRVMIHEQYFYEDYKAYQPDFEEKLITVFSYLTNENYSSFFFEELI